MNKTQKRIFERLFKLSLEDLEKLSEFARSKTEKTLANRLLKLFYKKQRNYKLSYWLAEPCSFGELEEETTIRAFSLNHAIQITLKEQIRPIMRKYCEIEDNTITYIKSYDRNDFSENYTQESFVVEDLEDLKDICMTANALILVHRTNRKNPYYTKLWKALRQNKNPIVRGLRA